MSSVFDAYVGVAEETTYNTAVAPTRFYEFLDESIVGKYDRITSAALRAGTRTARSDRWVPNPKGADGTLKTEVLDASFGLLLKHALGAVSTSGAADPYTHTFSVGDLLGKSLTVQVGRVDNVGALHPFTYSGGKIVKWELANKVDGLLEFNPEFDFAQEHIPQSGDTAPYTAATPTYPAGASLLSFVGGSVTIGGTEFAVSDASVKGDNGLNVARRFLRATTPTTKKEPLEEKQRAYTYDLKGEFDGMSHYNAVASASASGAMAQVVLKWQGLTAGHSLTVTLPSARFDTAPANVTPAKIVEQNLSGIAVDAGSGPITIAYATSDATP